MATNDPKITSEPALNSVQPFKPGANSGTYGEGMAYQAADYLKKLRAELDAGNVSVTDFIKFGKQAAEVGYNTVSQIAGKGSKAANAVNPAIGLLQQAGFKQTGGTVGNVTVAPSLPEEYQQRIREELLPKNIPEEQRKQIIEGIPDDIDLLSDEGRIYREGIIQSLEQQKVAGEQKNLRGNNLRDLASFLAKEEDRKFNLARPDIAEDANAAGLYNGTGYSEALARERSKLAGDTSALLVAQGLSDREADIQSLASVLGTRQGFQTAGLQRNFGLQDENRSFARARELAELTKPKMGSSSNIGSMIGTLLGGGIGSMWGPAGATAGATIGSSAGGIYDDRRNR